MIIWTIITGVLIIRVDRTKFDVITHQTVKVHRDRIFAGPHQEFGTRGSITSKITGSFTSLIAQALMSLVRPKKSPIPHDQPTPKKVILHV